MLFDDDEFDFDDDFFGSGDADPFAPEPALGEGPPPVPPRLGLLAALSTEEFDLVARSATLKHVEPGTVVFAQGDEADRFFILVDGEVTVERDGAAIAKIQPGEFFGESALLVGGKRSAACVATQASSLWSVGYEAFRDAVQDHLLAHDEAGEQIRARIDSTPADKFA